MMGNTNTTPQRKPKYQIYNNDYSSEDTLIECLHKLNSDDKGQQETMDMDTTEAITARKIPLPNTNKFCKVIDNALSSQECMNIIKRSEKAGYRKALVNIGRGEILDEDYRNSDRCIIDDVDFAKALFDRIKHELPQTHKMSGRVYEVHGLNERMRILKYSNGGFFAAHQDGHFSRGPYGHERSFHTAMIYLNEGGGGDFEGGSTNFPCDYGKVSEGDEEYVPSTGSVLVFDHRLLHEGSKVTKGTKYAIRTDVMYKAKSQAAVDWQVLTTAKLALSMINE